MNLSNRQPLNFVITVAKIIFLIVAFLTIETNSFSSSTIITTTTTSGGTCESSASTTTRLEATKAPDSEKQKNANMAHRYSTQELKDALASMLEDSKGPDFDARHIFGYGQADHELSMLQIITATRILDYRDLMVRFVCTVRRTNSFVFLSFSNEALIESRISN